MVARHEANALAEREGLDGIRRALGQLLERVDPGGADRRAEAADSPPAQTDPGVEAAAEVGPGIAAEGARSRVTWFRSLAVLPIRVYQRLLSPVFGQRCKYYPSCSEYAAQAIGRFGILRGLVLAGWRLLRCNPWSHGGFDPVEDQRLFKPRAPAASA